MERLTPVDRKLFTPFSVFMLLLAAVGFGTLAFRFIYGLGFVSGINQDNPWGIWNWSKITEFALSSGSFMTVALVYIFHRTRFKAVIRPALLSSALGYSFVGFTIFFDIGRYYNIWHLMIPYCWQGNSVLFEVGWCLILYLTVLYLEFIPVGTERFSGRVALPGPLGVFNRITDFLLSLAGKVIGKVMAVVLILGIVFSCLHQSSLGGLMLIAPYKVHPAWFTPVLPLLFLLSAFAVGLPMAIFISLVAGRGLDRPIELPVLSGLSRYAQVFLGLFLALYVGNMVWRRTYVFLGDGTLQGGMFLAEALLFILPFVLLFFSKVRETEKGLFAASSLVILAIMVHRLNVMLISYTAPFTDGRYAPKLTEYLVLMGIFGLYVFLFRSAAVIFPIFPEKKKS